MSNSDNKTKVRMKYRDHAFNEWEVNEIGYIDGYVTKGDKTCIIVVIKHRLILCDIKDVSVISQITYNKE